MAKRIIANFLRKPLIDNFLRNSLIPNLVYFYLNFVHKTSKIKIINGSYYSDLIKNNDKIVFAIWHGRQFSALYIHKNQGITVLVSPSRDGNVQSSFLKKFGFKTIRGSSDKNPVKSLIKMIKTAKTEKCHFAFAVDGPKGPVYKVKQGITGFAAKTGYKILPITSSSKFKFFLKTWDKCLIPLPFNKITIMYGQPVSVSENCDIDTETNLIEKKMAVLLEKADEGY
ncbi:lysophospholipid acyltransferase family protein [Candidatus Dependentiae bacterium]|mgnify:CR=1 FL=1|nr:lysophospholipid acyltransferase family protein [Candidatus Dependentiae bacterium]